MLLSSKQTNGIDACVHITGIVYELQNPAASVTSSSKGVRKGVGTGSCPQWLHDSPQLNSIIVSGEAIVLKIVETFLGGRGFVLSPAGGAHSAHPDSWWRWELLTLPRNPTPTLGFGLGRPRRWDI